MQLSKARREKMSRLLVVLLALAAVSFATPETSPKVVGGEDAAIGEFPHQISLQQCVLILCQHVCGGTLISQHVVLTAAHCVVNGGRFKAKGGVVKLSDRNAHLVDVKRTIVHEDYKGGATPNDIALAILDGPMVGASIGVASLPPANELPIGVSILSGWGSTSTGAVPSDPDHLQKVSLPLLTYEQCRDSLEDPSPLAESNICTGPLTGGRGACTGDSGGPLVQREGAVAKVIGIVSWSFLPCGSRGSPSVYTRVSAFIDWIQKNSPAN